MKSILFALIVAAAAQAESLPLPSPDQILQVQEREARERGRARGTEQLASQQQQASRPMRAHTRYLSASERAHLRKALEKFFREHPGVIIDARSGKPVKTSAHR